MATSEKRKDKYYMEKAWLRSHGITNRVPPKFLRHMYWRHRISAVVVLLLIVGLGWFFFNTGYW
jgi:hypothetical protein